MNTFTFLTLPFNIPRVNVGRFVLILGHNYNYNNKNKNNKPALLSTERLKARVYSDNKDYSATNASTMNIELPAITLGFSVCYFCCTIKLGKKSYNLLNKFKAAI